MTNAIVTYNILVHTADIVIYGESPTPLLSFTAVNIHSADDVDEVLAGIDIELGERIWGKDFTANYRVD